MSNKNPHSRGGGGRDSSGKYCKRHGYVSKSRVRRRNKCWIPARAR